MKWIDLVFGGKKKEISQKFELTGKQVKTQKGVQKTHYPPKLTRLL